ncbi:MAG: DUF5343 domain-containing protein [bacterium]
MPITSDGQAPYAPPAAVLTVIEGFRERGLQTPFTLEVLTKAGVPESVAPRTLQALKLLDLVDGDGEPTQQFSDLARAPQSEFPDRLAAILHGAYQDVFKFVNLDEDDYQRVRDAFRHYKPRGQQERMVTLFLHLCEVAGLVDSIPKRERAARPASAKTKTRVRRQPRVKPAASSASDPKPQAAEIEFTPSPAPSSGQHPLIRGLIQSLPEAGAEWPQGSREAWVKAALANFELVYELPSAEPKGGDPSS